MSQRLPDYDAYRAAQARRQEADRADNGEQLTSFIHTRRRRKCIAEGAHFNDGWERCGL